MTVLGAIFEVETSIDKFWDLLGQFDKNYMVDFFINTIFWLTIILQCCIRI